MFKGNLARKEKTFALFLISNNKTAFMALVCIDVMIKRVPQTFLPAAFLCSRRFKSPPFATMPSAIEYVGAFI
jgi:hypothetical protein